MFLCFTYVGFFDIPSIPLKTDVIYGWAPCDKYHSTKISHFHLDSFVPLFVGIYAFISGENLRFYPSVALSLHTDPNRKYFDTLFCTLCFRHWYLCHQPTTKNVCWPSVRIPLVKSFWIFKNLTGSVLNKLKLNLIEFLWWLKKNVV